MIYSCVRATSAAPLPPPCSVTLLCPLSPATAARRLTARVVCTTLATHAQTACALRTPPPTATLARCLATACKHFCQLAAGVSSVGVTWAAALRRAGVAPYSLAARAAEPLTRLACGGALGASPPSSPLPPPGMFLAASGRTTLWARGSYRLPTTARDAV